VRAAIARADETALDVLARGVVGAGRAGQAATGFLSGLLFNVEQERMALDQKLASIDTQRSKDAAGNLGAILQNFMKGIPEQIAMSERLRSVDAPGRAIQSASSASGIPEQVLRSIARIESNFDPNARGAAGEIGMFQIMPEVATTLLRRVGAPTQNVEAMLRDPKQSAGLAAQLLRELVAQVGLTGPAEDPRSWANVVQAYNLGQPKYAKGLRVPEYLSRFLQAAGE
jgi:soluble lytic murein transglycosylase-like protein